MILAADSESDFNLAQESKASVIFLSSAAREGALDKSQHQHRVYSRFHKLADEKTVQIESFAQPEPNVDHLE